jgi:hypothetical protein
MRRKTLILLALAAALLVRATRRARATSPAEIQAGMAAAPVAASAIDDVAAIGLAAGRTLYLPLGAGQVLLSPLPGITIKGGLINMGKGLLAPFQAAVGLLKLPFALVRAPASHAGYEPPCAVRTAALG